MKVYDPELDQWLTTSSGPGQEHPNKKAMRAKLLLNRIPFHEDFLGIYIDDADEARIP